MASNEPRYLRASLAVLLGGVVGVFVFGPLTGWALQLMGQDQQGLEALLPVLFGAAVGSFVCGAAALWITFRQDDRHNRLVTVVTVLAAGPLLFIGAWEALAPLPYDLLSPQFVLAVSLVIAAIAGRWIAMRGGGDS